MPHIDLRSDLYGITSLLDYRKEAAEPLCELTQLLLRGESTLTESERELIAAYVSYLNECTFCTAAHATASCILPGGDASILESAFSGIDQMDASDKLKSLLKIAAKVQQSGLTLRQEDINNAKNNGATDTEIHDTVLIAALFCFYNRYVDGLATRTPDNPLFYEVLGNRIATRGYKMPADGYHALNVSSE
ncbi:MAG: carboxymuconolactone decarboxylase family protein [Saprospiraceae bacterium]|uniref:Carboxymuconolactone decarboxylase family protein n=1 Tax=Candidatus Opimibacter skivensis TaxID=2982028 RepID=A0A9D7SUU9_9BACT|nr:carboxymuconolactone decarboxylase family protein [Candidatus Opimibacter skivensis]